MAVFPVVSVVEKCCEVVGREGKLHGESITSKGITVFTKFKLLNYLGGFVRRVYAVFLTSGVK